MSVFNQNPPKTQSGLRIPDSCFISAFGFERHRLISAAILGNEIGWFDDPRNSSSTLSSRLESDATLLRTIVVDRATILLLNCGFIVTAFIIAFMLNWRLTLVVLSMYPLIVSGHISEVSFFKSFALCL